MGLRRILLLTLAALALVGCVHQPFDPITESGPVSVIEAAPIPAAYAEVVETGGTGPYRLGSGDKLRVVVFGQEGLTNTYSVDANGSITMALIGSVRAQGLTAAELSQTITARLKKGFIREPHVAVEIENYRPFFILGEVTAPGQYAYVANMTAETAVAIAGGFTPRAWKNKIEITRQINGQLVRGPAPLDYPIQPGDTINVGERWF